MLNWPADNADNVNHSDEEIEMKKGNKENIVYLVKRQWDVKLICDVESALDIRWPSQRSRFKTNYYFI